MKISKNYPPNYQEIVNALGDVSKSNPVFCYGDTIFNPFGREITPDVEHHELVHSRQQAKFTSPGMWYMRYLSDPQFRLAQEIEAYGNQYLFGCKYAKNNKLRKGFLYELASELSGEAYGGLLSYGEAESKIRHVFHNSTLLYVE
jgi:hypothetical protein